MQTSAVGSLKRRSPGFTLLELLVVLAIIALATAGVGFAMRDASEVQLEREAERLAALLESARARSRVTGVPVHWRASADGFHFEGLASTELPEQWLDPGTGVANPAASLLLGPEPIIGAQELVLITASQPGKHVRLATDGVRPFAVLPAAP
jgi:general secretion pathway protein H